MELFPLWLLQGLVVGGIALCAIGVVALLVMLFMDSKDKSIW